MVLCQHLNSLEVGHSIITGLNVMSARFMRQYRIPCTMQIPLSCAACYMSSFPFNGSYLPADSSLAPTSVIHHLQCCR